MNDKPLHDVKVLDLTRVLAGPTATMILGDLGADVIKVENPSSGDETRQWGPPFQDGESAYFFCANRNKRSIAIDLKKPSSKIILQRLTRFSDVVIMNYPLKHLEKLDLTEEWFRSIRADIIWANISGFGLHGSRKNEAGYDIMIQGLSGLMSITGEPDREPMKVGVAIADVLTALYTVIAVVSALYQRKNKTLGCAIDNSLLECTMASLANVASAYLMNKKNPERYGNQHPNIVPYQVFQAKDQYFILAVGNDNQWQKTCLVLQRDDLAQNPDYASNQLRVINREKLIPLLSDVFLLWNVEDLLNELKLNGVPCGLVRTLPEAFSDPLLMERNFVQSLNHPKAGTIELTVNPIRYSHVDLEIYRPPPLLGEHSREILKEVNFTPEEINTFFKEQIVR